MNTKKYLGLLRKVMPLELERGIDDKECAEIRKNMNSLWSDLSDKDHSNISKIETKIKKNILDKCNESVKVCTKCEVLCKARNKTVFGTGDINADLVLLGEAPGADEDRQGVPFVGRAGDMLDQILKRAGISREEVYILNILKCRPPGNRDPEAEEAKNCKTYLDIQIKCIRPRYIMCLGRVASQNLLQTKSSLKSLRQAWHSYGRCKVICTFHPSALCRFPKYHNDAWEDWQLLLQDMRETT